MHRSRFTLVLPVAFLGSLGSLSAQQPAGQNPVLGVVTSAHDFLIGSVDEKPEAGPVSVVSGDVISSASSPVVFRLTGENRVIMAENSKARIQPYKPDKDKPEGAFFYQTKGSLQYDARREPLAICAADGLYVPTVPGSGVVAILPDNKVQVTLTTGKMERSGTEACGSAGPLLLPTQAAVAAPTGAATATATATAAAAGVSGAAVTTAAAIGIATATAAGVVAGVVTASQAPPSQSPTTP